MSWRDIVGPFVGRVLAAMVGVLLVALLGVEAAAPLLGVPADALKRCVSWFNQQHPSPSLPYRSG